MAFDITSVLQSVSGPDTEQIEYIDLDRIDPDPENFYSLDRLDRLAANIELIGLQQPLRVRPGTEAGRYTIGISYDRCADKLKKNEVDVFGNGYFRDEDFSKPQPVSDGLVEQKK